MCTETETPSIAYGRHADRGAPYSDETVIVWLTQGSIYRIGGDTIALRTDAGEWKLTGA